MRNMDKKIFYSKTTIILFIIISLIMIFGSLFLTSSQVGAGFHGLPFPYYCWNTTSPELAGSEFILSALIADLIIYYGVAVLISLLIYKKK